MTERVIQAQILDYLRRRADVYVWRSSVGFRGGHRYGGPPGTPDIIGMFNGRFLGIEVKGPQGKLTPEQEAVRDSVISHGGLYVEARSVDDVANAL